MAEQGQRAELAGQFHRKGHRRHGKHNGAVEPSPGRRTLGEVLEERDRHGRQLCGRGTEGVSGPRAQASGLVQWTTKGLPSQGDGSVKGVLGEDSALTCVPASLRDVAGTKC